MNKGLLRWTSLYKVEAADECAQAARARLAFNLLTSFVTFHECRFRCLNLLMQDRQDGDIVFDSGRVHKSCDSK